MRKPRSRRRKRSLRKHTKQEYTQASVTIQRCFRSFLETRYSRVCSNYSDDECILLEPVKMIPRDVFVVINDIGFDCRNLLTWMTKSNSHPLSRDPIPDSFRMRCIESTMRFLEKETKRNSKRKGFFSRKKILRRTLDRHLGQTREL